MEEGRVGSKSKYSADSKAILPSKSGRGTTFHIAIPVRLYYGPCCRKCTEKEAEQTVFFDSTITRLEEGAVFELGEPGWLKLEKDTGLKRKRVSIFL
jgi:hypothetical protein